MYNKYHTKGIVMSHFQVGEKDSGVVLFSKDFGLVYVYAVGTRKMGSKIMPGIQELSNGEYTLIHTKKGMKMVGQRVSKNYFEILRDDNLKLKKIKDLLSFLRKLSDLEEKNESLYMFIEEGINLLCGNKVPESLKAIELLVVARVLKDRGFLQYSPELDKIISVDLPSPHLVSEIESSMQYFVNIINASIKSANIN